MDPKPLLAGSVGKRHHVPAVRAIGGHRRLADALPDDVEVERANLLCAGVVGGYVGGGPVGDASVSTGPVEILDAPVGDRPVVLRPAGIGSDARVGRNRAVARISVAAPGADQFVIAPKQREQHGRGEAG